MERILIWSGQEDWEDGWHAEIAQVELGESALRASGTQLGIDPVPYRLEYRVDASGEGFVTRSLRVEVSGAGWERRLRLEHDEAGEWAVEVGGDGEVDLPAPGGDAAALTGALDCDLGFSPLTNAMPVRRHALHERPGEVDFLMAWVSVPDLAVEPLAQRYTHLSRNDDGAVVRYESLEDGRVVFRRDLELDADGLVRLYPQMARRLGTSEVGDTDLSRA
jgi:hypothetical protein